MSDITLQRKISLLHHAAPPDAVYRLDVQTGACMRRHIDDAKHRSTRRCLGIFSIFSTDLIL